MRRAGVRARPWTAVRSVVADVAPALVLALGVVGCAGEEPVKEGSEAASGPGDRPGVSAPQVVVDSIRPIAEEIERFREGLQEVEEFSGGAGSLDGLVTAFVDAVERADTSALAPLLLTREEFGWLVYPHTMYTRPPYELSPALLWFQMENLTSRSLLRMSRRLFGRPLHASGYRCEEAPRIEDGNRVWDDCRVLLAPPGADTTSVRLFGSIVERGGVYKFVSYSAEM